MVYPSNYLRRFKQHLLVDPVLHASDYVRVKVRLSFKSSFAKTFDEGVGHLLDEIGPRPTTGPEGSFPLRSIILTQCDAQEPLFPDTKRGIVEFGVSTKALPRDLSLSAILAVASYVAAYSFVVEYTLLDINFPEVLVGSANFPGPKYGHALIDGGEGAWKLGVLIKPRFISDREYLRSFVAKAANARIDYIIDDELTVGGETLSFEQRADTVVGALEAATQTTQRKVAYICNITGSYDDAIRRTEYAHGRGIDGVMVNAYAMGYDALAKLASDSNSAVGILANGLGLGVLTRGPHFRIATELIAKLARLSGADGVYTGPFVGLIDSDDHSSSQLRRALTQPYCPNCKVRESAAVMSGGVGLREIIENRNAYQGPLYLSMGYQFSEYVLSGHSSELLVDCIREISNAVCSEGLAAGRSKAEALAKKNKATKECLEALRTDDALSE